MNIWFTVLLVFFLIVCLFMSGLILIQRGRGGGLASAFGGAGGNTAFGAKTGDVLTWTTAVVFVVFMLMTIGLNVMAEDIHNTRVTTPVVASPVSPESSTNGPTYAVPTDETASEPTTQPPSNKIAPTDSSASQPALEPTIEVPATHPTVDSPTTQPS